MRHRGLIAPGDGDVHDDGLAGDGALGLCGYLDRAGREVRSLIDGLAVLVFHDGESEGALARLDACDREAATSRSPADRRDRGELVIALHRREVRLYVRPRVAVADEIGNARAACMVVGNHVLLLTWRSRLSSVRPPIDRLFAQMPCSSSCLRRPRSSRRARSRTRGSSRCRRRGCRTAWSRTS